MDFLIGLIVFAMFSTLPLTILFFYKRDSRNRLPHNENHQGITINTIEGKKDIICPKCKSPNCQYEYDTYRRTVTKTSYRVHPLNVFNPISSKTKEVPTVPITSTKFRCQNCGWIFK